VAEVVFVTLSVQPDARTQQALLFSRPH